MSIEVKCDTCGSELEADRFKIDCWGDISLEVPPCEECMKEAEERGKED